MAQMTDPRAVIDRTQVDLRRAEDFERGNGKQVSRYDNAQKHLSEFDRNFTRGHFDKGNSTMRSATLRMSSIIIR
jgi:hypothetical protein